MKFVLPRELASESKALLASKTPLSFRQIGRWLFALFIAVILALTFTPWQQTVSGFGRVIAFSPDERQQNIKAPVDGRLGTWYVHEGSPVNEGDLIVEMTDNDPDILMRLEAERDAASRRLNVASQAAKTVKLNVDRQTELFNQGIASKRALELSQIEYNKAVADESAARAELARIETRFARQNVQSVRAPRKGTILRRTAGSQSELVKTGEILAILIPSTESRAVEVWVDGNDVPLIHDGDHVRLQFEGWPAVQFSGWPSVAVGTFGGKVSFVDSTDNGVGRFRLVVIKDEEPWPSANYLRQGVRANGWILLRQVSLGYELWRRLNGFPPALSESTKPADLWQTSSGKEGKGK